MSKNQYQTYTPDTPLSTFREDFVRRAAMCAALAPKYPELAPVAADCDSCVAEIDARLVIIQQAEDAQTRAKALEDVEKIELVEAYTEARRTMSAKNYDVLTILPDMPSVLARKGPANLSERMQIAIDKLNALPDGDPIRTAFVPVLEKEYDDFSKADLAEDKTSSALKAGAMAIILYKTELSQRREAQLGKILAVLRDKEKMVLFTIPWRKSSKETERSENKPQASPSPT